MENKFTDYTKPEVEVEETVVVEEEPKPLMVKVAVPALNIRKAPTFESDILGILNKDEEIELVKKKDEWGKIKGRKGWICLEYTTEI